MVERFRVEATMDNQFVVFQNAEQLNQHMKGINLNELAENRGKLDGNTFKFDSIGLQLFVSDLLQVIFLKQND